MANTPSPMLPPGQASALAFLQLPGVTAEPRRLAGGSLLFRQGGVCQGVYLLVAGRLRLVRCTSGGTEVGMHTVRPGELFAEAALFSPHYHCDAVALEDCELLLYPKQALARQLMDDPTALWSFTAELAHRVQVLRSRLENRQIRSARERILQFLRLRCDPEGMWRREGSLKHLAEEIGLTHEALYRALAALEHEGRITRTSEGIHVQPAAAKTGDHVRTRDGRTSAA